MKTLNKKEAKATERRELSEQELLQATGGASSSSGVDCSNYSHDKDVCEEHKECAWQSSKTKSSGSGYNKTFKTIPAYCYNK